MFLPLAGSAALAISFAQVPLDVRDVDYVTVSGEDVLLPTTNRTIQAAVDPSNSRALEQIFGGSVSDGSIGIWTLDELYIGDQYVIGEEQRQSYVVWGGYEYRVTDLGHWTPQANVRVYLAKRHVTQDVGTSDSSGSG